MYFYLLERRTSGHSLQTCFNIYIYIWSVGFASLRCCTLCYLDLKKNGLTQRWSFYVQNFLSSSSSHLMISRLLFIKTKSLYYIDNIHHFHDKPDTIIINIRFWQYNFILLALSGFFHEEIDTFVWSWVVFSISHCSNFAGFFPDSSLTFQFSASSF